jgi:hypothetical protein
LIVTAHQPNFLAGASVFTKIEASDAVIWLDECQYSHGGWTNRNKLPSGRWLTVPVAGGSAGQAINRVRIGSTPQGDWRTGVIASIRRELDGVLVDEVCAEIARPYRGLAALNIAILRQLSERLVPAAAWHFQSHLDGGHAVIAQSADREELAPISARIAAMVAELGGSVYLSGPSGRNYLDETPFFDRGIAVEYWRHDGANPCALELAATSLKVAA